MRIHLLSSLSPFRECLKRSPGSPKAEGSDSATSQSSPSEEVGMMTEVKVKTEVPDDYIEEVIWQDDTKDSKKSMKDGSGDVPAEICVVIGGVRNQQTLGEARGTVHSLKGVWAQDEALESCAWTQLCWKAQRQSEHQSWGPGSGLFVSVCTWLPLKAHLRSERQRSLSSFGMFRDLPISHLQHLVSPGLGLYLTQMRSLGRKA